VTVTGAGFLLNDEMDDFATSPGEPNMYGLVQGEANAIAPGKRMLSAMTPSIVLDPRKQLYLVVGTPGGPRIITMVYHVISNVIDHRMTLPDAVVAPRMHHQGLPDSLRVEAGGFLPETLDSLRSRGHGIATGGYWGDVEAIIRTPAGWHGGSLREDHVAILGFNGPLSAYRASQYPADDRALGAASQHPTHHRADRRSRSRLRDVPGVGLPSLQMGSDAIDSSRDRIGGAIDGYRGRLERQGSGLVTLVLRYLDGRDLQRDIRPGGNDDSTSIVFDVVCHRGRHRITYLVL